MYLCEKCLVTGDTKYDYHLQDHMASDYVTGLPCHCTICDSQRVWIDDNIAPIITTLWKKRIMTLGCCGGHSAVATPEEGMYHKLYTIFDFGRSDIDFALLERFCRDHDGAYLRYEPYNGIGLYMPSKTFEDHCENIAELYKFCDGLPMSEVHSEPAEITPEKMTSYLNFPKFFYDIVVYDADETRQLISFNLHGIYQFNIAMKPAFCPSRIQCSMFRGENTELYNNIKSIMKDYPIETLIANPKEVTKYDMNSVIQRLKALGNSIVPDNVWDKPKTEDVTKVEADS